MDGGQHARDRIDQGERHAVGDHDHERDAGHRGDERVRVGDRIVVASHTPSSVLAADHGHPGAVDLVREDSAVESDTERRCRAGAVRRHVSRPVADMQAQVERVIGRFGHPAVPGGHRHRDAEGVRIVPAHQRNAM